MTPNIDRAQILSLTELRYVLFDAVGTLLRVQPSVAEIYHAVGSRHGSRLTTDDIGQRFADAFHRHQDRGATSESRERERWRSIVQEVLHDISHAGDDPFEELWEAFSSPEHWVLYDDVADVWTELQRRGYVLGIASNFDQRLPRLCQGLPPLDTVKHLFVSSRVGFPKPCPEFFRHVERELSAEPSQLLLIGDNRTHDYEGALAAGWQALHLCRDGSAAGLPAMSSLRCLLGLLS